MPSKASILLPILLLPLGLGPACAQSQPAKAPPPPTATSDAAAFCAAIRDPAAEARYAWQAQTLKGLETRLAETLKRLEERRAELQRLHDQRAAEVTQAEARMTEIFARMRPEAAALQLAAMDQEVAVAVLGKLAPRAASAVLNEMEAARAAQLAEMLGGKRPAPSPPNSTAGARIR